MFRELKSELSNRYSRKLYEIAADALSNDDFLRAKKIGSQLVRRRYTGGHEILGRVELEEGNLLRAIAHFEDGIEIAHEIYTFWSFLGECHSNLGQYEQALLAFRRCAELGDKLHAELNLAIVYGRMGEFAKGLAELTSDLDLTTEVGQRIASTKVWLLAQEGAKEEAANLAHKMEEVGCQGSLALAIQGEIYFANGETSMARQYALMSIRLDKTNFEATELLRRLYGKRSSGSKVFRCLIEGKYDSGEAEKKVDRKSPNGLGFFATYYVQADSPESALDFIGPFEPHASEKIVISEFQETAEELSEFDGVISAHGGYTFFSI